MEALTTSEEDAPRRPAPSPSASPIKPDKEAFWSRGKDRSLESFQITTTPFHDADEDGEYYMDEAGHMLHRWVVKTEVKGVRRVKAGKDEKETTKKRENTRVSTYHADKATAVPSTPKQDSQTEEDEDGKTDSGWGSAASASGSSGSSTEEAAVQRQTVSLQPVRPRLNRHSRSSFRPSERANHASPERIGITGRYQTETATATEDGKSQAKTERKGEGSDGEESIFRLSKALSCPSSPLQQPVTSIGHYSSPPSPKLTHSRTLENPPLHVLDGATSSRAKAPSRPQQQSRRSSFHTSINSRSINAGSRVRHGVRKSIEDPYLAHQRAVSLFSPPPPPPSEPKPLERTQTDKSSKASIKSTSNATKTISAAVFLASKPEEVVPIITPQQSNGSERNSSLSAMASNAASDSITEPVIKGEDSSGNVTPNTAMSPLVPVLTDHRIALDWTHPETRAREARRRNGIVGRMKRMLSRSRSRDRGQEFRDDGSVRRMHVGSLTSIEQSEENITKSKEVSTEHDILSRGRQRGFKGGWNCFG